MNHLVTNLATNRLLRHEGWADAYTYDDHGNITSMPHLSRMGWDWNDRLRCTTNGTVTTWYCYDAAGNRVRKVTEKPGGIVEDRIYAGIYERYTRKVGTTTHTLRETIHLTDNRHRFALVDKLKIDNGVTLSTAVTTTRYQHSNHLGSASLELNQKAAIISYEEYHPFGTTSYRSGRTETEVAQKLYKYVGKERDEETGLYYYGARYYAAWLARFVSVDPLQFKYPHYTPYQYAGNKPVSYVDLDGLEEADAGSKPANNNGNESINKKEEQQLLFFKTKKFQNELKSAELENAAIDYIYSKINQNIGSNSEIVQYRNGLRSSHETFIIKQTISQYITVNGVSDAVSVKSPETGEVAFLLNFVKKGASYAIGEALPFEAKALSGMFKSLGDLALKEALLAKGINSVSMKPKEWRAPRLIENSMRLSNVSKGIGSFLKIAGKSANLFGSVLLYYDLLNVNSPKRMDDSDIQRQTVNAMNVFLNSTKSNE